MSTNIAIQYPVDYYGKPVQPGVRVAYNYSGEVRLGSVINVQFCTRYGKTHRFNKLPYLKIKIIPDGQTFESTVTNPNNLVVIPMA